MMYELKWSLMSCQIEMDEELTPDNEQNFISKALSRGPSIRSITRLSDGVKVYEAPHDSSKDEDEFD